MSFKLPPNSNHSKIPWFCGSCVRAGIKISLQQAVKNKILEIALSKHGAAFNILHSEKKVSSADEDI